jgi:hypothetical protein
MCSRPSVRATHRRLQHFARLQFISLHAQVEKVNETGKNDGSDRMYAYQ